MIRGGKKRGIGIGSAHVNEKGVELGSNFQGDRESGQENSCPEKESGGGRV